MIAVVDDDAAFLSVMEDWLTSEGYAVVTARQQSDAVRLVRQARPAVLILDFHLRIEAAGIDVLQALRADPATRDLPIIVLSADARALQLYEALLFRFKCDIVPKPFDLDMLLALIKQRSSLAPALASVDTVSI